MAVHFTHGRLWLYIPIWASTVKILTMTTPISGVDPISGKSHGITIGETVLTLTHSNTKNLTGYGSITSYYSITTVLDTPNMIEADLTLNYGETISPETIKFIATKVANFWTGGSINVAKLIDNYWRTGKDMARAHVEVESYDWIYDTYVDDIGTYSNIARVMASGFPVVRISSGVNVHKDIAVFDTDLSGDITYKAIHIKFRIYY